MLLTHGAVVDAIDRIDIDGETALHIAARNNNKDVTALLLGAGAAPLRLPRGSLLSRCQQIY